MGERRHYHQTSAAYVLPDDDFEKKRLNNQAAALVEMIGGNPFLGVGYFEDERHVSKVADVGCGTGVATMQLARVLPSARVWGVDISPTFDVARDIAPANVHWVLGNVLELDHGARPEGGGELERVFERDSLDYVFCRMLFLGINDWRRYFGTVAESLKSGGVVEHQDMDWGWYSADMSRRIDADWDGVQALMSAVTKCGLSLTAGSDAASYMNEAGLEVVDVQTFDFSWAPSSNSPYSEATIRYVQEEFLPVVFPELHRRLLGSQGFPSDQVERLARRSCHDVVSVEGSRMKYTVTIARKP